MFGERDGVDDDSGGMAARKKKGQKMQATLCAYCCFEVMPAVYYCRINQTIKLGGYMYFIGFLLLIVIAYFLFNKKPAAHATKESSPMLSKAKANGSAENFSPPIPAGYQIFAGALSVAGLQHRKDEAFKFARSYNQRLTLEREPSNQYDKNAIKIIGLSGSTEYFIGYLPKELSAQIVGTELFDSVIARLVRIYIGNDDFLDIQYQVLGLKTEKKKFDGYLKDQPAHSSQKDYFKFFGLPVPRGLTAGQAEQAISEHKKSSEQADIDEWEGYSNIVEEFDDKSFREDFDLKKPSKAILLEAINHLKAEGKSYKYLSDNIDEVVEKVIELKPELERQ